MAKRVYQGQYKIPTPCYQCKCGKVLAYTSRGKHSCQQQVFIQNNDGSSGVHKSVTCRFCLVKYVKRNAHKCSKTNFLDHNYINLRSLSFFQQFGDKKNKIQLDQNWNERMTYLKLLVPQINSQNQVIQFDKSRLQLFFANLQKQDQIILNWDNVKKSLMIPTTFNQYVNLLAAIAYQCLKLQKIYFNEIIAFPFQGFADIFQNGIPYADVFECMGNVSRGVFFIDQKVIQIIKKSKKYQKYVPCVEKYAGKYISQSQLFLQFKNKGFQLKQIKKIFPCTIAYVYPDHQRLDTIIKCYRLQQIKKINTKICNVTQVQNNNIQYNYDVGMSLKKLYQQTVQRVQTAIKSNIQNKRNGFAVGDSYTIQQIKLLIQNQDSSALIQNKLSLKMNNILQEQYFNLKQHLSSFQFCKDFIYSNNFSQIKNQKQWKERIRKYKKSIIPTQIIHNQFYFQKITSSKVQNTEIFIIQNDQKVFYLLYMKYKQVLCSQLTNKICFLLEQIYQIYQKKVYRNQIIKLYESQNCEQRYEFAIQFQYFLAFALQQEFIEFFLRQGNVFLKFNRSNVRSIYIQSNSSIISQLKFFKNQNHSKIKVKYDQFNFKTAIKSKKSADSIKYKINREIGINQIWQNWLKNIKQQQRNKCLLYALIRSNNTKQWEIIFQEIKYVQSLVNLKNVQWILVYNQLFSTDYKSILQLEGKKISIDKIKHIQQKSKDQQKLIQLILKRNALFNQQTGVQKSSFWYSQRNKIFVPSQKRIEYLRQNIKNVNKNCKIYLQNLQKKYHQHKVNKSVFINRIFIKNSQSYFEWLLFSKWNFYNATKIIQFITKQILENIYQPNLDQQQIKQKIKKNINQIVFPFCQQQLLTNAKIKQINKLLKEIQSNKNSQIDIQIKHFLEKYYDSQLLCKIDWSCVSQYFFDNKHQIYLRIIQKLINENINLNNEQLIFEATKQKILNKLKKKIVLQLQKSEQSQDQMIMSDEPKQQQQINKQLQKTQLKYLVQKLNHLKTFKNIQLNKYDLPQILQTRIKLLRYPQEKIITKQPNYTINQNQNKMIYQHTTISIKDQFQQSMNLKKQKALERIKQIKNDQFKIVYRTISQVKQNIFNNINQKLSQIYKKLSKVETFYTIEYSYTQQMQVSWSRILNQCLSCESLYESQLYQIKLIGWLQQAQKIFNKCVIQKQKKKQHIQKMKELQKIKQQEAQKKHLAFLQSLLKQEQQKQKQNLNAQKENQDKLNIHIEGQKQMNEMIDQKYQVWDYVPLAEMKQIQENVIFDQNVNESEQNQQIIDNEMVDERESQELNQQEITEVQMQQELNQQYLIFTLSQSRQCRQCKKKFNIVSHQNKFVQICSFQCPNSNFIEKPLLPADQQIALTIQKGSKFKVVKLDINLCLGTQQNNIYNQISKKGFASQQVIAKGDLASLIKQNKITGCRWNVLDQNQNAILKRYRDNIQLIPIQIKQSQQKGLGVFATSKIPKKSIIATYTGQAIFDYQVPLDRQCDSILRMGWLGDNQVILWPEKYINVGRFLNGDQNPNVIGTWVLDSQGRPNFIMRTCKNVKKGQQLVWNYGLEFMLQMKEKGFIQQVKRKIIKKPSIKQIFAQFANAGYIGMWNQNQEVLVKAHSTKYANLASIIKLLNMCVCKQIMNQKGTSQQYIITLHDFPLSQTSTHCGLKKGDKISIKNLFYALTVNSSYQAAICLAYHFGQQKSQTSSDFQIEEGMNLRKTHPRITNFVNKMIAKARLLGMNKTQIKDPVGANDCFSTVQDINILLKQFQRLNLEKYFRGGQIVYIKYQNIKGLNCSIALAKNTQLKKEFIGKTGLSTANKRSFAGYIQYKQKKVKIIMLGFSRSSMSMLSGKLLDAVKTYEKWYPS